MLKTIITTRDNIKHQVQDMYIKKYVFVITSCNLLVAVIGSSCPDTMEHLLALPSCPMHDLPKECNLC